MRSDATPAPSMASPAKRPVQPLSNAGGLAGSEFPENLTVLTAPMILGAYREKFPVGLTGQA